MGLLKPPRPGGRGKKVKLSKIKRRSFLGRMLGAAAVVAIAPDILRQIEEYDYVVDGKPRPKKEDQIKKTFPAGRGFWAIYEEQIIGWSDLDGVVLEMHQDALEVTSMDSGGFREFIPAPLSARISIDNIRSEHPEKLHELFMEGAVIDIVATMGRPNEWPTTFSGGGILTEFSTMSHMNEGILGSATFQISGELIRTDHEDD